MRHTHHHIVRSWRQETRLLHIVLAGFLPAFFLISLGAYARVSFAEIASALALSLTRLFIAYAISLLLGVAIAVAVGMHQKGGEKWMTIFDVAQNVPSFALIPVFAFITGYSNGMIIAFATTSIIWPILFSTLTAIRTAHPSLNEAATVFGARGWKRVRYYLVPLAHPALVTGSIVGISIGWEAVIGAEIIGGMQGIGLFLNNASARADTPLLLAGLAALLLTVFLINRILWSPLLKHTYEYSE